MCLYYSVSESESVKRKLAKNGKISVYKRFRVYLPGLQRETVGIEIPCFETSLKLDKEGFFVSDRPSVSHTNRFYNQEPIHQGIHAYRKPRKSSSHNFICVRCTGYKKDFVGASSSEIVFTKIKIEKKDLEKELTRVASVKMLEMAKEIKNEVMDHRNNMKSLRTRMRKLQKIKVPV